jgi:hypothetical protein
VQCNVTTNMTKKKAISNKKDKVNWGQVKTTLIISFLTFLGTKGYDMVKFIYESQKHIVEIPIVETTPQERNNILASNKLQLVAEANTQNVHYNDTFLLIKKNTKESSLPNDSFVMITFHGDTNIFRIKNNLIINTPLNARSDIFPMQLSTPEIDINNFNSSNESNLKWSIAEISERKIKSEDQSLNVNANPTGTINWLIEIVTFLKIFILVFTLIKIISWIKH